MKNKYTFFIKHLSTGTVFEVCIRATNYRQGLKEMKDHYGEGYKVLNGERNKFRI